MEWPARMAIECVWPGLPHVWIRKPMIFGPLGINWLGWGDGTSPTLLAALYKYRTPQVMCIPALLIWFNDNPSSTWLIFENDEPGLFGRVYVSDEDDPVIDGEIPGLDTNIDSSPYEPCLRLPLFADWIAYQEFAWDEAVKRVSCPEHLEYLQSPYVAGLPDNHRVILPVEFIFSFTSYLTIPVFPWMYRDDPTFQTQLLAQWL